MKEEVQKYNGLEILTFCLGVIIVPLYPAAAAAAHTLTPPF